MGTSASVPLDIEAFRPQPQPDPPVQSDGYSAAAGVPASFAASAGLTTGADGATAIASAVDVATAIATAGVGAGAGGGDDNSDRGQEVAGGQGQQDGKGPPLAAKGAVAPTNPPVTGKRPRAVNTAVDGGGITSITGQEDETSRKRTPLRMQMEGRGGIAPPGLSEPGTPATPETSDIDVGDSSPAANTFETQPTTVAAGMFTAAANASNVVPPIPATENGALVALASIVTNPVATSIEPPQHGRTTEGLAVAPPQPSVASSGGASQPQVIAASPIDVGMESGESCRSAPPPPPPAVQPPVPEPPRAPMGGRFHQAPSLTQHTHAVSPQQTAAAAFGAAVHPQAAPSGGAASHLVADRGSLSVAAAGVPSIAALPHHPPLLPPLSAGTAGGGAGLASGGGAPRPKRKRPGPGAGKRPEKRKCDKEGCKLRPTFGVDGTRLAQFCLSHKPDDFVNVLAKRCNGEGCRHQPSFGMPRGAPVRCAKHRSDGMVNLSSRKCVFPGCRVVPSFAKPGTRRASTCSAHRGPGEVDIVTRRCHHEGCVRRPVFGDISTGKALYCTAHKLAGMMNVFAARCTAPHCMELATFGIPGIKRPTHCSGHRDQQQHVRITSYHS
eukprot:g15319.t1